MLALRLAQSLYSAPRSPIAVRFLSSVFLPADAPARALVPVHFQFSRSLSSTSSRKRIVTDSPPAVVRQPPSVGAAFQPIVLQHSDRPGILRLLSAGASAQLVFWLWYVKHSIQHPLSQQALDAAKELPLASFANLMGDNATALALTCSVGVCGLLHMYCAHTVTKLTLIAPDTIEMQTLTFGAFTRRHTMSRFDLLQPEVAQETKQYLPFRVMGKRLRFMIEVDSQVLDRERLAKLFKGQSLL